TRRLPSRRWPRPRDESPGVVAEFDPDAVRGAMLRLSDDHREVFTLRYFEDFTYAAVLNGSPRACAPPGSAVRITLLGRLRKRISHRDRNLLPLQGREDRSRPQQRGPDLVAPDPDIRLDLTEDPGLLLERQPLETAGQRRPPLLQRPLEPIRQRLQRGTLVVIEAQDASEIQDRQDRVRQHAIDDGDEPLTSPLVARRLLLLVTHRQRKQLPLLGERTSRT